MSLNLNHTGLILPFGETRTWAALRIAMVADLTLHQGIPWDCHVENPGTTFTKAPLHRVSTRLTEYHMCIFFIIAAHR